MLDLAGVTYISSAGWSDFVSHTNTLKKDNGDLKLAAMRDQIKDMYDMVGFSDLLVSYPSVDEAVKAFR